MPKLRGLALRIANVLAASDVPLNAAEIRDAVAAAGYETSKNSIITTLSRTARSDGQIRRIRRGLYAAPGVEVAEVVLPSIVSGLAEGYELSWADAAEIVLTESGRALHYRDITQAIIDRGLRTSLGQTPSVSANVAMSSDIKSGGANSRFIRTEPGVYMLRAIAESGGSDDELPDLVAEDGSKDADKSRPAIGVEAFGMYWDRDLVDWARTTPPLLGAETAGADPIDFSDRRGVYLLHDRTRTVYVGRVSDQPLSKRLRQHTRDRLVGRWDRFSWFAVTVATHEDGSPGGFLSDQVVMSLLEAILIEVLEPPLNRKRGDDMTEVIQVKDPALVEKENQALRNGLVLSLLQQQKTE